MNCCGIEEESCMVAGQDTINTRSSTGLKSQNDEVDEVVKLMYRKIRRLETEVERLSKQLDLAWAAGRALRQMNDELYIRNQRLMNNPVEYRRTHRTPWGSR